MLLNLLLGIPLGLLIENAGEWLIHRYVLHGQGKRPDSIWAYHWHEHHRVCQENGMLDHGYQGWPLRWNTQGKEALFLLVVVLGHIPLLMCVPGYVAGMYVGLACYYIRHRKSHLDPDWARRKLPWHYQHHMAQNSEANWCVAWPWFDRVMGSRHEYPISSEEQLPIINKSLSMHG
ncbi:sterol desaturase family protein [Candidatus Methylospira mobilis]|uniref:sterol desaturase family protein n=1 Tax=Candidatus Methylospira mobilis TaxID=1808979 RepID=UPI001D1749D5|nr:sterol desaturase family protein [Candidatus Methylospira mobilis]